MYCIPAEPRIGDMTTDYTHTTYLRGDEGWHRLVIAENVLSDAEMRALIAAQKLPPSVSRMLAGALEETACECGILPSTRDRG